MENFYLKPYFIWFVIGFILILLEFTTPGLVIVFFGAGAWLTALLCYLFHININLQIIIFICSSLIAILLLRKVIKNKLYSDGSNDTILEEFTNKKAIAETDISKDKNGRINFKGTSWGAESDYTIKKGETVVIISKESILLKVKPLKNK